MSDIDLTEAVEAGRLARRTAYFEGRTADQGALAAVTAAAPLIEAAVRAQVAQEIEAEANKRRREADETAAVRGGMRDPHQDSIRAGIALAARIARGGAA